jgi:anaerobic magnesium-protoporphyrin IX monomethyl ester cyclase
MRDSRQSYPAPSDRPLSAAVIVPPVTDFYATPHRCSGLGIAILRQCLLQAGCRVACFDFPSYPGKPAVIALPDAFSHLRPHLIENERGKLAFFTRFRRFGPESRVCADHVLKSRPDLVFISCFAFCYAGQALELARDIHRLRPDIPIIAGGAGVSAYPEFFLREAAVDFAVAGEAEVSIRPLLAAIRKGSGDFGRVPNLYRKADGSIISPVRRIHTTTDNIAFVMQKTRETSTSVYLTTALSRGCPKSCRFCSNFLCHGRQFRTIPADAVRTGLATITLNSEQQKKNLLINVEDDNLLFAPDYFLEILGIMKERFPSARFLAENGLDYTRLTPELADRLIACGMRQFNLSLSSVDPGILDREKRESHLPAYVSLARRLDERHIESITYFICGFAGDTIETVAANLAFLSGIPTRIGISMFYPVPGIPDFEDRQKFDDRDPLLCAGSSAYPWNRSLTTAQMITAFRLSRFINLMKSGRRTEYDNRVMARIIEEKILYTTVFKNGETKMIPAPNVDPELVDLFFRKAAAAIICPDQD